ncbi:NADH-quinone oxidoreductase subunit N [Actinocrinis puniceicyclus]|uniref:NADH-quinone oxidoreductase subunit N n=1 Tax=Actinocrinis puniceicyclus TaxID=977794 RepID=A0A8J8B9V4_9ACTN|nr:NADH-quinone oxidoreductase subunit N [Actinocrinis puniceicyclus]MBS2962227.1 NADH-quinone oxidoreductase subunit N [Actinocrinis puniceicyclus]
MNVSALLGVQSIDYVALLPVLLTAGGALAVLLADLFLARERRTWLVWGTLAVLVAALIAQIVLWSERSAAVRYTFCVPGVPGAAPPRSLLPCSYAVDDFTLTLQTLALAATVLVVLMAPRRFDVPFGEYHFLLLSSLTGALVLVAARDFVTVTVALETLSLPAFALVGFGRRAGGEAALKFFLMSIASTAVMLFGLSLVYGATGSLYFSQVYGGLLRAATLGGAPAQLAGVGAVLTLVGFGFKISAVPFHFWTPEVYAGAPVPVAAYLSVVSKAAGFAGLILAVALAFQPYAHSLGILLAVLAAATMTVGNVIALRQRYAVRLLAWSTVAQAGYVLVPLAVSKSSQVSASVAYLVLYAVMNLGAFAVVSAASGSGAGHLPSGGELAGYRGMYRRRPRSAVALAFFLLCLAGLPPGVMGLFAKVAVFKAAVTGDLMWLAVVMAVNVVIALYYYLRWAAVLFDVSMFGAAQLTAGAPAVVAAPVRARTALAANLAVGIAFALAVVLSFWPNPALDAVSHWR